MIERVPRIRIDEQRRQQIKNICRSCGTDDAIEQFVSGCELQFIGIQFMAKIPRLSKAKTARKRIHQAALRLRQALKCDPYFEHQADVHMWIASTFRFGSQNEWRQEPAKKLLTALDLLLSTVKRSNRETQADLNTQPIFIFAFCYQSSFVLRPTSSKNGPFFKALEILQDFSKDKLNLPFPASESAVRRVITKRNKHTPSLPTLASRTSTAVGAQGYDLDRKSH